MGAAASIAMEAASAGMPLPVAGIFVAGLAVGAALGLGPLRPKAADDGVVSDDGLNFVYKPVEVVMSYTCTARIASSVYKKVKKAEAFLKEAKAFVKKGIVKPVCDKAWSATDYLRSAASSAFKKLKAAAAFVKDKVIKLVRRLLGDKEAAAARHGVVLSGASTRVAGCALALQGCVASLAACAARRASEMMALLKDVPVAA